jgi:hypothetical protein
MSSIQVSDKVLAITLQRAWKKPLFTPKPKIPMNGTCRAKRFGYRLPLGSGMQDIEDCLKNPEQVQYLYNPRASMPALWH